jgi:hypothetical protein
MKGIKVKLITGKLAETPTINGVEKYGSNDKRY